jgi:hypothetical protein
LSSAWSTVLDPTPGLVQPRVEGAVAARVDRELADAVHGAIRVARLAVGAAIVPGTARGMVGAMPRTRRQSFRAPPPPPMMMVVDVEELVVVVCACAPRRRAETIP